MYIYIYIYIHTYIHMYIHTPVKVLISESREEDMGHVVGAIADNKRDDLMLLVRAVRDDVSSVAEAFGARFCRFFDLLVLAEFLCAMIAFTSCSL